MENHPDPMPQGFRRAFLVAYGAGIMLCVVWPLILQAMLGSVIPSRFLGSALPIEELGYTFTGLVILSALFVVQRSRRILAEFQVLEQSKRTRRMTVETCLYAAVLELSAFFGLLYHSLGGTERYARSFITLPAVMFFLFVPKLAAWRKATEPKA